MNRTGITQHTTTLGPLNFGNGLLEIGALTTLVGSNTAGDLAVGNRGSAGMVWGSITTFGNASVIKVCVGAALPGWVRHILGLRTRASDEAVGMVLPLGGGRKGKFAQAVRSRESSGPLGLVRESDGLGDGDEKYESSTKTEALKYNDALVFDRTTSVMLEELTSTSSGHPLQIYTFHPYDCFPHHNLVFQSTALGLSLLKFTEAYYLFLYGGPMLGLLSIIPFTFSFIAAIIVEMTDMLASRRPMSTDGHVDIIVGCPPTTKRTGGPRKVVLGALKNPKTTLWWRAYYAITASLQIASLFIYYQLFGQEQLHLVLLWAGFQVAWVTLRTVIFHFTDSIEPMLYRRMTSHELGDLSPSMRLRVLNLVGAVGTYRTHLHPRAIKHYKDDTFSAVQITKLLTAGGSGFPTIHDIYELPKELEHAESGSSIQIDIVAVMGDTLLSAATWLAGTGLSPMDVYDSCILVLAVQPHPGMPPRTIAIPAARVFSGAPYAITDSEGRQPAFVPRGAGHRSTPETRLEWIYWIPCTSGLWLHFWSREQTVMGRVEAMILSDRDVNAVLGAGALNVSLRDAGDVRGVVDVSREAADSLLCFVHPKSNFKK